MTTHNTQQDRNYLLTYLVLVFALSVLFYIPIINAGSLDDSGLLVLGLMWMPAAAALITSLVFRRGTRELGWRLGKRRYLEIGYLLPVLYGLAAYGFLWLTGLGGLDLAGLGGSTPLTSLLTTATFGFLISLGSALGEEIGWRGLLVPALRKRFTFVQTALISGVIWTLWHSPLILFSSYNGDAPLWFAFLCFSVLAIGISFPMAWLRLASGSLWPAAVLHASHNLYIQTVFDRITTDTGPTAYLSGEFGALLAILAVLLAILFARLPLP